MYSNQFVECTEKLEHILSMKMSRFWTKEKKRSNKSTMIYQSQHFEQKLSRLTLIYIALTICLWSLKTQHSKTIKSHQKILKIDFGNTTQASTTNIRSLWMNVFQKSTKYLMWQTYITNIRPYNREWKSRFRYEKAFRKIPNPKIRNLNQIQKQNHT